LALGAENISLLILQQEPNKKHKTQKPIRFSRRLFSNEVHADSSGRLWAYVRQLSACEVWAAKAVQQTEEMLFVLNWRGDIDADCFVGYRGIFYNVTRVDTFEGYKEEDLKVYGARMKGKIGHL